MSSDKEKIDALITVIGNAPEEVEAFFKEVQELIKDLDAVSITRTDVIDKQMQLLNAIRNSYHRMATNRDVVYRTDQRQKCLAWLDELTELYEKHPQVMFNGM